MSSIGSLTLYIQHLQSPDDRGAVQINSEELVSQQCVQGLNTLLDLIFNQAIK